MPKNYGATFARETAVARGSVLVLEFWKLNVSALPVRSLFARSLRSDSLSGKKAIDVLSIRCIYSHCVPDSFPFASYFG